ncbi:hypothetical protein ACS0TY_032136 [Phlomoides rotata]
MVRESEHGTTTLSIVPLLQERFRQLQRMKELRQEQELLRMLSESERSFSPTAIHNYELVTDKFSIGSQQMFLPPKPHCQLSLSLWPQSSPIFKHEDCGGNLRGPLNLSKSLFTDAPLVCAAVPITLHQNSPSDIDTSLRL